MCSDGLSGSLDDQDLLGGFTGGKTLESGCAMLVERAVKRGSEDDITVIVAEVSGEGAPVLTDRERLALEGVTGLAAAGPAAPAQPGATE